MSKHSTWFIGDTHFGHKNIITFKTNNKLIRPFTSIAEHDETLQKNYLSVVKPEDRVYFFGDLFSNYALGLIKELPGRKKLIKGNHDNLRWTQYGKVFEDVVSYRIYPEHGMICSHIPVHPCQLQYRFKCNVHGHLHGNLVYPMIFDWELKFLKPNKRYINICPEHTQFMPVNKDTLVASLKAKKVI